MDKVKRKKLALFSFKYYFLPYDLKTAHFKGSSGAVYFDCEQGAVLHVDNFDTWKNNVKVVCTCVW